MIFFFCDRHKLNLISFHAPPVPFLFLIFKIRIYPLHLTPPPPIPMVVSCSLSVSVSPFSAGRQPARSFTLSDSVMHPVGQRLDDVIWAKGCVNTAVTLVLDLSIGLGWRTEKRIVLD